MLRVNIDQDKARQLGVTSQDVASLLNSVVGGATITQVRDNIYLINVVGARRGRERALASRPCRTCRSPAATASRCRCSAFATIDYELEQPLVWRRDRQPTITAAGERASTTCSPTTVVKQLKRRRSTTFRAGLPEGYNVATGGTVEESAKAQGPIADVVPVMLFLMATFLMIQLQSFQKLFLVVSVAPLGLIGVVAALLLTGTADGLRGDPRHSGADRHHHPQLGDPGDARSTSSARRGWRRGTRWSRRPQHRLRPILLTAAAASLGMIPIAARGVLGTDGLRHDRRHHRRDLADAAVPAGALCRLVQDQGAARTPPHSDGEVAR